MDNLLVVEKEQTVSKGKGNKPLNFVKCPRCAEETAYNGFHPATGLQKYKCKDPNCRCQFIPGLPHRPKEPRYPCPLCGAKMYIFKNIPGAIRLRCANYRKKGKERCTHKINIPLPGEEEFKVSKDPIEDLKKTVVSKFYWNKMDYSKETVSLALFFAAVIGLPANLTSFILSYLFRVNASHDSVTRWAKKSAISFHKNLGPLEVPKTESLHFDETGFKEDGRKTWLWLGMENTFNSIQGYHFSHRRATEYARNVLSRNQIPLNELNKVEIVTDGLWSYGSALGDLPEFSLEKHHVYRDFTESINNNRLERKWGSLKDLSRRFRGFKSRLGLWSFVTNQVYLHNYFWPQEKLGNLSPAEKVGLKLPPQFACANKQRGKYLCSFL